MTLDLGPMLAWNSSVTFLGKEWRVEKRPNLLISLFDVLLKLICMFISSWPNKSGPPQNARLGDFLALIPKDLEFWWLLEAYWTTAIESIVLGSTIYLLILDGRKGWRCPGGRCMWGLTFFKKKKNPSTQIQFQNIMFWARDRNEEANTLRLFVCCMYSTLISSWDYFILIWPKENVQACKSTHNTIRARYDNN